MHYDTKGGKCLFFFSLLEKKKLVFFFIPFSLLSFQLISELHFLGSHRRLFMTQNHAWYIFFLGISIVQPCYFIPVVPSIITHGRVSETRGKAAVRRSQRHEEAFLTHHLRFNAIHWQSDNCLLMHFLDWIQADALHILMFLRLGEYPPLLYK